MSSESDPWKINACSGNYAGININRETWADVSPLDSQLGVWPKSSVPDVMRAKLFDATHNTYALVDAARVPEVPELLAETGLPHGCLFRGRAKESLSSVAPWIVEIGPDTRLTREFFTSDRRLQIDQASPPEMLLKTKGQLADLSRHLRRFIRLRDYNGRWSFFRFWDARILADYLWLQGQEETTKLGLSLLSLDQQPLHVILSDGSKTWHSYTVSRGGSAAPYVGPAARQGLPFPTPAGHVREGTVR